MFLEEGVFYDQCVLLTKLCQPLPCFILYSKAIVQHLMESGKKQSMNCVGDDT